MFNDERIDSAEPTLLEENGEVEEPAVEEVVPAKDLFGPDFPLGPAHPHGSNILKKAGDALKSNDAEKTETIQKVASKYVEWRRAAEAQVCTSVDDAAKFVNQQTLLYQNYRDILDNPSVDDFDSRGALQPSALEEFCYFLLFPLFSDDEKRLAVGHREVYQSLYFTAPNFSSFSDMPLPSYPVANLDFVIGKELVSSLSTESTESKKSIFVPAVAIECKTYIDRPRLIGADQLAASIKRGFPGCLVILLSEFLKLDLDKVNVLGSPIDAIYVLRRAKNVDRKTRRADSTVLKPIHLPAVLNLFCRVRDHLREDWASPEDWEESGILK